MEDMERNFISKFKDAKTDITNLLLNKILNYKIN